MDLYNVYNTHFYLLRRNGAKFQGIPFCNYSELILNLRHKFIDLQVGNA